MSNPSHATNFTPSNRLQVITFDGYYYSLDGDVDSNHCTYRFRFHSSYFYIDCPPPSRDYPR